MAPKTKKAAKPADASRLPEIIHGCAASCGAPEWIEAAAADNGDKLKKFSGVAYTGGTMSVGYGFPVVLDLNGITQASEQIAALKDHDPMQIVGHMTAEIGKRQIKVAGVVSGISDAAAEVTALSANDFPWQMSVGVSPSKLDFIERNESQVVNGRKVEGPAYVVRAGQLREVSFVAIGADPNTSGRVAASIQQGEESMNPFDKWLEAAGWDKSKLSASQLATLQAAYDAEQAQPVKPEEKPPVQATVDPTNEIRAKAAAEFERVAKIQEVAKDKPAIIAQAVKEGWDTTRTELEVLRASRPAAPAMHVHGPNLSDAVINCAFRTALTLREDEKSFDAPTLEASRKQFRHGCGLQQLLELQARANGWTGHRYKDDEEGCLRAAFSTISLPSILTVNFNYMLLQSYNAVEDTWRQVAAIKSGSDFKTMTSYRMTGDMLFQELGATGELQHGTVGEQTYTNQIDTYGRMFAVPRKEIINDNLGAFSSLAQRIGRGGALAINKEVWTKFMANTGSFWHTSHTTAGDTGNANYATGAGTALSITSLTEAELLFYSQVDPDGNPLGVQPSRLLVPNALFTTGANLMASLEVRDTTASTKYATSNPHAGKFQVVRSSYLSNAAYTGYSALAWYLLADPMELPVVEIAFLNGQQQPTVEQAQADFNTLGVQFRGYFDFGAAQQDFRAGVKMKGEA